ncbi:MAG: PIG-L family deacetylase [Candidatus Omnitrophica bacterium]|nr:PIG-L family deacetylase [Candidatus Omnitrophota bacterium]MBU1995641.1 PIG-L family deacetylase [Candidatus Omnitrophota bacterium]
MNILAIGAHPDDIELGCAGTLLKYAKSGDNVYLLVLSDGSKGGDCSIRKLEQIEASKILGVKELIWGNWNDTEFDVTNENVEYIESIVKRINPDEIYVNYFDDSHQDHRALAQCVISATRYCKRVLFYEDYTSQNFEPNIFVDIGDVLNDKFKLMRTFKSQLGKNTSDEPTMLENIKAVARFRGFQAKINFAEGFMPLRYIKLLD